MNAPVRRTMATWRVSGVDDHEAGLVEWQAGRHKAIRSGGRVRVRVRVRGILERHSRSEDPVQGVFMLHSFLEAGSGARRVRVMAQSFTISADYATSCPPVG